MTANEFVNTYAPYAFEVEKEKGIPAIAILAQAALESGWGNKAIGNNFFGIKYNSQVNDKFQRVLTTEYFADRSDFENKGFEIENVEYNLGINKFRVLLYQKFADYDSPKEAFLAHANLLLSKRYVNALTKKENVKEYLKLIAESGYATDPNYASKMSDMVDSITKRL